MIQPLLPGTNTSVDIIAGLFAQIESTGPVGPSQTVIQPLLPGLHTSVNPINNVFLQIPASEGWGRIFQAYIAELRSNEDLITIASDWGEYHIFNGLEDRFIMGRNRGRLPYIECDWNVPEAITNTFETDDANMEIIIRYRHNNDNDQTNRFSMLRNVRRIASVLKSFGDDDVWKADVTVGSIERDNQSAFVDFTVECNIILGAGSLI